MKGRLSVWIVLGLLLALFSAPGSSAARAEKIGCTGSEMFLQYLSPGEWSYPGGNIHVRQMISQYQESSSCPEIAGVNTTTMNANWSADWVGSMWGTTHAETDFGGGGIWEGSWQGAMNPDGSYAYQAVSHGVAGSVLGLELRLSAYSPPGGPTGWTATILDPHGD